MTKWIVLIIFSLLSTLVNAQKTPLDSASLQTVSNDLLDRKINFHQQEGKLETALDKLSQEQKIKFSYSNDKIQHVTVSDIRYQDVELSYVLTSLLKSTGFTYIVVGRIIVIVEDEKKASETLAPKDSIPPVKDSIVTPSKLPPAEKPLTYKMHVYTPENNQIRLNPKERREIHNLYKREVAWSIKYRKSQSLFSKDSLPDDEKKREPKLPLEESEDFHFYVMANFGLIKFNPKIKENTDYNWKEELNFEYSYKTAFQPSLNIGYIYKNLFLGTGFGFHTFTLETKGIGYFPRGQSGKVDTIDVTSIDKYRVFTIPVEAMYCKMFNKVLVGAGTGLDFSFIGSTVTVNRYQKYFEKKGSGKSYSETHHKVATSASVKFLGGFRVRSNMALIAGIEYNWYLSSFSENSLYTLLPNHLTAQLSFCYLINKHQLADVFSK